MSQELESLVSQKNDDEATRALKEKNSKVYVPPIPKGGIQPPWHLDLNDLDNMEVKTFWRQFLKPDPSFYLEELDVEYAGDT